MCRYSCKGGRACPLNGACSCMLTNPFAPYANATAGGPCAGGSGTTYTATQGVSVVQLCWNRATNAPISLSATYNGAPFASLTVQSFVTGPQPPIVVPSDCTCEAVATEKQERKREVREKLWWMPW